MFEKEIKKINKSLASWGQECLESGEDKYVALTYKGDLILKNYLDVSEFDVVFGKITLTWKDSSLNFKYIEFEPFQKTKKSEGFVKFKNKNGENEKYKILFLPRKNKFVIQRPDANKFFNTLNEAKAFINKYKFFDKFDRDFMYGLN